MTTDIQAAYAFITEPNPMGQPFLDALAGKPNGFGLGMDRVIAVVVRCGCKGAGVALSEADQAELTAQVVALQKTLPAWKSKVPAIFV